MIAIAMLVAAAFTPHAPVRILRPRMPACVSMVDSDENITAAFAATLQTSPLLRQYAAGSPRESEAWDSHLRLYPRKLTGMERVRRVGSLISAYWELVRHVKDGTDEVRDEQRRDG
jgi:hypothetical protein